MTGGEDRVRYPWSPEASPTTPRAAALRQRWEGIPLRTRLVAILLVALAAALAATGYGVQAVLRGYLVEQIDEQLLPSAARASGDGTYLESLLEAEPGRFPSPIRIQLSVDDLPRGPYVVGGDEPRGQPARTTFPVLTSSQAQNLAGRTYDVTASDGSSWRATSFAALVQFRDGRQRPVAVTILQGLGDVDEAVGQLRRLTLGFGLVVMALCTLLGWLAIRRAFVPLVEVERTAAAIAAGDLSQRVPEHPAATEVGRLTRSLNGMLTQIESAFREREASQARTRRFAADASHELRTPLASIRGYAELYRQGAVPPEEVPRTMGRIEDEATRMGHLVEDLLLLARLDEQRPARRETVDLAVLAGDAVHDARGLDPGRQVRLVGLTEGTGPVPSVVTGDEDRLRQVVANLVANAVRHTPAGTPVEVAVGVEPDVPDQDGGHAVLDVRDHGPGLPPEHAARVFERFYRVDASRQRGRGGGSGLGLSIVAAVVAAHGGSVEVLPTPGGGATFRVRLPRSPA